MPYPEPFIAPMRAELTRLGIEELRTPAAVDAAVRDTGGTLLIVVNSVCGCAAGKARPGLVLARAHAVRPTRIPPVFAGPAPDAPGRARRYFEGYPPSSPSMGLLRDGRLLWMLERRDIENRGPEEIAALLTAAFDAHCGPAPAS